MFGNGENSMGESYDEDKAVDAVIAEVMDEIAVEVGEVSETKEPDSEEADAMEDDILEELELDETNDDLTPDISGLELCRRYYEEYGKPMIAEKFPEYETRIAAGLVGKGSDCFGFDDMQSRDHDFGPRFLLWVTKDVYEQIGTALEAEYEKLPDTFLGVKRIETFHGKDLSLIHI